ncbi:MAG: recombinase family protein, partial [Actinomycetota bacterium]
MGTSRNRVVVYARLSRDRTGEETATSRQLAACKAYAKAQGWHIVGTFREADVSGWIRKERPEFEAALQVLRVGEADGLLAWKLDRVGRRVADVANLLEELTDRKQFLASATEPLNTATPMGRAMVGVIAVLAELEAATRSERARAKHAELAKTGRWSGGGRRPFGYSVVKEPGKRAELIIYEPEAKLLRDAARRVLEGASLSSVVTSWNEQGIETPSGGRWTMADMRRVLLSSH